MTLPEKTGAMARRWLRNVFHKLRDYDLLEDNARGLRRALETQERVGEDLRAQLEERDTRIEKLRGEYAALQERQAQRGEESAHAERLALFKRLRPIATQLPTLRAAINDGADITAHDVIDLLSPLDQTLHDLGFEVIGEAGAQVSYDPQRHKAVGREAHSVAPGDTVRVRYVGYLYDDKVVCKAEVTQVRQQAAS
jgi:molecular chaperone GrpE (heat shock protein)